MSEAESLKSSQGEPAAARTPLVRRVSTIIVGTLLLGGLCFLGLGYLADSLTHEWTDDAFIDADIVSIAPRVFGQVKAVFVARNQSVKAGDPILDLDPRDLAVALNLKRAATNSAWANVALLKAQLALSESQVASADAIARQSAAESAAEEAVANRASADLKRAVDLFKDHTISPQEFDAAKSTAALADANWKAAQGKAASSQAKVEDAKVQVEASRKALEHSQALAKQAEWEVQAAALNLSYTHITAPVDGQVTRKSVEAGDYVQVGQNLMALVPRPVFITANFKETQLVNLRTNQRVRIDIDSVPGGPFPGFVESIQAGSGSAFSLLPPENAVGNFVKVVQRVPVRIFFDEPVKAANVLGPGMSVVPSVHVTDYEISEKVVAASAAVLALLFGALWWTLARKKRAA